MCGVLGVRSDTAICTPSLRNQKKTCRGVRLLCSRLLAQARDTRHSTSMPALFSSRNFLGFDTVPLSLLLDK